MANILTDLVEELTTYFLRRDEWVSWTPTVTQSGSVVITVNYARYAVLGNTVILRGELAIVGSGSAGSAIVIGGIPSVIAPAQTGSISTIGTGEILDSGSTWYVGALYANGASDFRIKVSGAGDAGVNPSFALANGDAIGLFAAYERS